MSRGLIHGLVRRLGSLRLTLWLLVSLAVLFLLGLFIPQKAVVQRDLYFQWKEASPQLVSVLDFLGLTEIYASPLAIALWALFFVNLGLVMWKRVGTVRNLVSIHPGKIRRPESVVRSGPKTELQLPPEAGREKVEGFFSGRRFRLLAGPNGFYAVRNRLSPLATLLFHMSFFLVLVGGILAFYSRFTGRVELAEGEEFTGEPSQYVVPPKQPVLGSVPKVRFLLSRIDHQVEGDTPVAVEITIEDEAGVEHVAEINRPYRSGACSFVFQDLGIAPLVVLKDETGGEVDGAWVKLDVLQGKEDKFQMANWDFVVEFFPDLVYVDNVAETASQEFNNPAFRMWAWRDGEFIDSPIVQPGEEADLEGFTLSIPETRYWVRFYVRQERGLWLVWLGFGIASVALIWRLLFYRREYWVAFDEEEGGDLRVEIAARSEYYKALFEEEFTATIEKLHRHLKS